MQREAHTPRSQDAFSRALESADIFGTLGLARSDAFVGREYRDASVHHSNMWHAGSAL